MPSVCPNERSGVIPGLRTKVIVSAWTHFSAERRQKAAKAAERTDWGPIDQVEVFQFDVNTGPNAFLGYVTQGQYDIWTDIVFFKVGDPAMANGVVNDNVVRVWGTVGAPQSYSTRMWGSNTVPTVDVKYLTKQ